MTTENAVCRGELAIGVDTIHLETTYVPMTFQWNPYDGPTPTITSRSRGVMTVVSKELEKEIKPHYEEINENDLQKLVQIEIDTKTVIGKAIQSILPKQVSDSLQIIADTLNTQSWKAAEEKAKENSSSLLNADSFASQVESVVSKRSMEMKLFQGNWREKFKDPQIAQPSNLFSTLSSLGFLFLERLRVRPIGWTRERSPFYELCLTPGEVVTLKQRSFSKRALSLAETVEKGAETTIEYSSTFTTELQEEYNNSVQDASNWGVNASVGGSLGNPKQSSGAETSIGGSYGASHSESESRRDASKRAQELSRKVASKQTMLHRTVMNLSSETTFEEESVRVMRNADAFTKKIFFRRMMQVLHLSYERYGARLCWAPCIEEPGRDIQIPGPGAFPEEEARIRSYWESQLPPPEVTIPDANPKTLYSDSKKAGQPDEVFTLTITLPEGFLFKGCNLHIIESSVLETGDLKITKKPESGSRDPELIFKVEAKLELGESAKFCIRADFEATPERNEAHKSAVQAWREEQIQKDIEDLIKDKRDDLAGLLDAAWPQSEIMRRIIRDYYGEEAVLDCELARRLETLFEWENLSYELHAPWWKPKEIKGLQSLPVTFANASYATAYVPIRPGYEAQAVSYLITLGALGFSPMFLPQMANEIQSAVANFLASVCPRFEIALSFDENDAHDIIGPADILLTKTGDEKWVNDFESEALFEVLDRWVVTIPTDGVDLEEAIATCELPSAIREADEKIAQAEAKLKEAIAKRVDAADANIQVTVNWPGDVNT